MLEKIGRENIEVKKIGQDETEVVLQRHEEYVRDKKSESAGRLTPEAVITGQVATGKKIRDIIEGVPQKDRESLYFLVLSSDTIYEKGARSIETGQIAIDVIKKALGEHGMKEENLLNFSNSYKNTEKGEPRPTKQLREPLMFERSPEFVAFLKTKYPDMKDFWKAYETDAEKETREKMGAEGTEDMADRLQKFLGLIKRYSQIFHKSNPNSRLVVWCASHYDTISPWTKKYVLGEDATGRYLPVDYGAGLNVNIDKKGKVTVNINGNQHEI